MHLVKLGDWMDYSEREEIDTATTRGGYACKELAYHHDRSLDF
jgi:hypothetical protein